MEIQIPRQEDIPQILEILAHGRQYQLNLGFTQWPEGYPSREIVELDLSLGRGRKIVEQGEIIAYVVIDVNGDPEYDAAPHLWSVNARPYAAIHRLALSPIIRGKGLSVPILELVGEDACKSGVRILRAETGLLNLPMQHALKSAGYSRRGEHVFSWGPRVAYELNLE